MHWPWKNCDLPETNQSIKTEKEKETLCASFGLYDQKMECIVLFFSSCHTWKQTWQNILMIFMASFRFHKNCVSGKMAIKHISFIAIWRFRGLLSHVRTEIWCGNQPSVKVLPHCLRLTYVDTLDGLGTTYSF